MKRLKNYTTIFILLLIFLNLILQNLSLETNKKSIMALDNFNISNIKKNNLSKSLLALTSKEFGCKMKIKSIYDSINNNCPSLYLFENIKNILTKFQVASKYLNKVDNTFIKTGIDPHFDLFKQNVFYEKLTKQTLENMLNEFIKCPVINLKMEIGIKLILKKIQLLFLSNHNDKNFNQNLTKYNELLNKLVGIISENKTLNLSKLELKLVSSKLIEKINKKMIQKLSKLFGNFFISEVNFLKNKTEKLLKNNL
jgi:hypothetical protein